MRLYALEPDMIAEKPRFLAYFSRALLLLCTMFAFVASPCLSQPSFPKQSVVFFSVKFSENSEKTELGTGFLVDHDGLVATADHVLVKLKELTKLLKPGEKPEKQAEPISIKVYASFLDKPLELNCRTSQCAIYSSLSEDSYFWVDIALIRIPISKEQRSRLKPLSIATRLARDNEWVVAYGPTCSNPEIEPCSPESSGQRSVVASELRNNVQILKLSDTMRQSFSGGPIVDSFSEVLGITSWGTRIPALTTAFEPYGVPAIYLEGLVEKAPQSSFFASNQCGFWKGMENLTSFDVWQSRHLLDPQFSQGCECLCRLAKEMPVAVVSLDRKGISACLFKRECGLTEIGINQIKALKEESGLGGSSFAKLQELNFELYREAQANPELVSQDLGPAFYKSYADYYFNLALQKHQASFGGPDDWSKIASSAFAQSLALQPSSDSWRTAAAWLADTGSFEFAFQALNNARKAGLPYGEYRADRAFFLTKATQVVGPSEAEKLMVRNVPKSALLQEINDLGKLLPEF